MKRYLRSILVCIVALLITVSYFPAFAFADSEVEPKTVSEQTFTGSEAKASLGQVQLGSTNSFGKLLTSAIDNNQDDGSTDDTDEKNYPRFIEDVEVSGNNAVVSYYTEREVDIIVAVYNDAAQDEPKKLLGTGIAKADPEEETVSVEIDIDSMPQYFRLAIYMMDDVTHEPVSDVYYSDLYSQEIQELLSTTTDDYDADRVIDLDGGSSESQETNFAVLNAGVFNIVETETANIASSIDENSHIYVIENADEYVRSMYEGATFAYTYGENNLLVGTVSSITVNGTTVTIRDTYDAEVNDAFEAVKIDADQNDAEVEFDPGALEDGVTFAEKPTDAQLNDVSNNAKELRKFDIEGSTELEYEYTFKEVPIKEDKVKITGTLGMVFGAEAKLYVKGFHLHLSLKLEVGDALKLKLEGEGKCEVPIAPNIAINIYGIKIGLHPQFVVDPKGSIEFDATVKSTASLTVDTQQKKKFTFNVKTLTPEVDFKAEGSVFIGVDLDPHIAAVDEKLLNLELEAPIGVTFEACLEYPKADADVSHDCKACIDGDIYVGFSAKGKLTLFDNDKHAISIKILEVKGHYKDFYVSLTHQKSGWGICPYKKNRVTVRVLGPANKAINGASITTKKLEDPSVTNSKGYTTFYLPNGNHKLNITADGYIATNKTINVYNTGVDIVVKLKKDSSGADPSNPGDIIDSGNLGMGEEYTYTDSTGSERTVNKVSDAIKWTLYDSGLLEIKGTGKMNMFIENNYLDEPASWSKYASDIVRVDIGDGIEDVGDNAFINLDQLTKVTLPESIVSIGSYSFYDCTSLEDIDFPPNLQFIETGAFCHTGLKNITIPDSVLMISDVAFSDCSKLSKLDLGNGVKIINSGVFSDNPLIKSVVIPESVIYLGDGAFSYSGIQELYFRGDALQDTVCWGDVVPGGSEVKWGLWGGLFSGWSKCKLYIPAGNDTWTDEIKKKLSEYKDDDENTCYYEMDWQTWAPPVIATADSSGTDSLIRKTKAYSGDLTASEGEEARTVTFIDLVAGEPYILVVVKDKDAADLISTDNILYIWQDTAEADSDGSGRITFTGILRDESENAEAILFGAGGIDISGEDCEIDIYDTEYDGMKHRVQADVWYNGSYTLEEGRDYELEGDVIESRAGTYSVTVKGKGDYYGSVTKSYKINKCTPFLGAYNLELSVGQSSKLDVECDITADLVYRSSDNSVAAVSDQGVVTAKKAGTATITITLPETDNYNSAEDTAVVTVVSNASGSSVKTPAEIVDLPSVKISKPKAAKKKITVKWKKVSNKNLKKITGIQIQVATDSKFKNIVKTTKVGKKKTSKTIKGLKPKTKYYVRIRAFAAGNHVSKWSKKSVKVK